MASLISKKGLEFNRREHDDDSRDNPFGSYGYRWEKSVRALIQRWNVRMVLDYGAGKGTLAEAMSDVPFQNYDPVTFPGAPSPADLVVCTDVLPFVEPEFVDAVLADIHRLAAKGVFIVVPQHPDYKREGLLTHHHLLEWYEILKCYWPHHAAEVLGIKTQRMKFVGKMPDA